MARVSRNVAPHSPRKSAAVTETTRRRTVALGGGRQTPATVATPAKRPKVNLEGAAPQGPAATSVDPVDALYASFGVEVIETSTRPADVEAAKAAFAPTDYTPRQRKWAAVVGEAIGQLGGGRIMIKRPAEDVLSLLTDGGRLSTIFDMKSPSEDVQAYRVGRLAHEQRLGTHGVGEQAGQTVYGSVEFAAHRSGELLDDEILKCARKHRAPARSELNTGFPLTHDAITLVMKPGVNPRTTFLPGDSYIAGNHKPRAVEQLPFVVLDNILEQGDMYFTSKRGSDALFALPHDEAVEAVKAYLTSGAVNRNYLEAQLRAPTLDDVAYVVIHADLLPSPTLADGRTVVAMLDEIRQRAKARGVTVVDEQQPTAVHA